MRIAISLVVGLATALTVAAPAPAITRGKADKVAIRALKPPRSDVLFRLSTPLPKGSAVIDAGGGPRRVRALKARTWLYWLDKEPGARFEHPSVLLLIDDRTGRVVKRDTLEYWPEVARKGSRKAARPPWLKTMKAYRAATYRAFPKGAAKAAGDPFPRDPMAHFAQAPILGANDFKHDCLVQVGNRTEAMFQGDFDAMASWADKVGLQHKRADGLSGVETAVGGFVTLGCKDVFLQISGHGSRARPGVPPTVAIHQEVLVRNTAGGFWETT